MGDRHYSFRTVIWIQKHLWSTMVQKLYLEASIWCTNLSSSNSSCVWGNLKFKSIFRSSDKRTRKHTHTHTHTRTLTHTHTTPLHTQRNEQNKHNAQKKTQHKATEGHNNTARHNSMKPETKQLSETPQHHNNTARLNSMQHKMRGSAAEAVACK